MTFAFGAFIGWLANTIALLFIALVFWLMERGWRASQGEGEAS